MNGEELKLEIGNICRVVVGGMELRHDKNISFYWSRAQKRVRVPCVFEVVAVQCWFYESRTLEVVR